MHQQNHSAGSMGRTALPIAAAAAVFVAVALGAMSLTQLAGAPSTAAVSVQSTGQSQPPELGREHAPTKVRQLMAQSSFVVRTAPGRLEQPVDVLAHSRDRVLVGFVNDAGYCSATYLRSTPTASYACAPLSPADEVVLARSRGASASDAAAAPWLSGVAPAATRRVLLEGTDGRQTYVRAFSAGADWNRTFFVADWPATADTTVTAFGEDGQQLAQKFVPALVWPDNTSPIDPS